MDVGSTLRKTVDFPRLTFLLSIIAVKSANRACFKNKYYTFKSVSLVALKSRSLAVLQVLKIVK